MLLSMVGDQLAEATPMGIRRGVAPCCGAVTIAKTGDQVMWHWAHEKSKDCDPWSEPESQWHLDWKRRALAAGARVEVSFKTGGRVIHRADIVLADGRIVEVQRSSLSITARLEREAFYGANGGMFWIQDVSDSDLRPRVPQIDPYSGEHRMGPLFDSDVDRVVGVFHGRLRSILATKAPQVWDFGDGALAWRGPWVDVPMYGETWIGLADVSMADLFNERPPLFGLPEPTPPSRVGGWNVPQEFAMIFEAVKVTSDQ